MKRRLPEEDEDPPFFGLEAFAYEVLFNGLYFIRCIKEVEPSGACLYTVTLENFLRARIDWGGFEHAVAYDLANWVFRPGSDLATFKIGLIEIGYRADKFDRPYHQLFDGTCEAVKEIGYCIEGERISDPSHPLPADRLRTRIDFELAAVRRTLAKAVEHCGGNWPPNARPKELSLK